jgi:hypothetical protein
MPLHKNGWNEQSTSQQDASQSQSFIAQQEAQKDFEAAESNKHHVHGGSEQGASQSGRDEAHVLMTEEKNEEDNNYSTEEKGANNHFDNAAGAAVIVVDGGNDRNEAELATGRKAAEKSKKEIEKELKKSKKRKDAAEVLRKKEEFDAQKEEKEAAEIVQPLSPSEYGPNSPGNKRKRAGGAECWNNVMRLIDVDASRKWKVDGKSTHYCTLCHARLTLSWNATKHVWVTTAATSHNNWFHKDLKASKKHAVKEQKKNDVSVNKILNYGHILGGNKREKCLTSQARLWMYCPQSMSLRTSEAKVYREMIQATYEAGGGTDKAPLLSLKGLISFIRHEYDVLQIFLRFSADKCFSYSFGNASMQSQNDGVTLSNSKKYNAMSVQFIDHELKQNHVVCYGMKRCNDGTGAGIAKLVSDTFLDVFGKEYLTHCHSGITDELV